MYFVIPEQHVSFVSIVFADSWLFVSLAGFLVLVVAYLVYKVMYS